jgi:integrase
LKKENIQLSCDGKLWIKGRRQKTDTEYNIPLLNIPKMILGKYEKQQTDTDSKLLPVKYLQKYNSLLKEIAKTCGIDKRITSHVARHTFATLALEKGMPIETVSKILGHTNITTTQIYAKITTEKLENDISALGGKLADSFKNIKIQ